MDKTDTSPDKNLTTGSNSFYLGEYLVEPESNSISHEGESLRVEPKAMEVLVLLAANAGQVVSRQELEDQIWANMVVGPDALTNSIIKLRRALGDDAKNSSVIETIPKKGYRLIAEVREVADDEPALKRRLSAILYTDVAEYSRLTGEDEERTHRLLSARLDYFSESIESHNGKVVHYAGDAILAEFSTVTEALSCAVAVQQQFKRQSDSQPDELSVQFRIGINLGEVIVDRDDIYGEGVNIAARLEGLSDAGGICISESVYAAVGNKLPLDYDFMGEQKVKNIEEPVRAYRVVLDSDSMPTRVKSRSQNKIGILIAACVIVALAGALIWTNAFKPAQESATQTQPGTADRPTIAVLPFANVSLDPEDDLLAEGMTRDIITDLTKVSGAGVIAHSTMASYLGQGIDVSRICAELAAQYLVEGSIRRFGEQIQINANLVDCSTQRHRWGERYDDRIENFFELQNRVIAHVVTEISVTLTASEDQQLRRLPTNSLEAWDYFTRARQAGFTSSRASFNDTINWYKKAIEIDPEFAEAHSGLARAAVAAWRTDINDVISNEWARKLAYNSASRALDLDPANGQAYSVLAILQLADSQHEAAIESARTALERAPGSASAHLDLGFVLAFSGKSREAVVEIEKALNLDPYSPETQIYAGIVFFIDKQYERAVEILSRAQSERSDASQLMDYLAASFGLLGETSQAAEVASQLLDLYPSINQNYYRSRDTYFRQPEDLERFIHGLAVAGIPQWPYGFHSEESNRLRGEELHGLVINKNWMGRLRNGIEFFQHIDGSGRTVYRSQNSLRSGQIKIQDDQFCHRFESSLLDRETCGFIYHNPDGTPQTRDEFILVMPDSLRYFSLVN